MASKKITYTDFTTGQLVSVYAITIEPVEIEVTTDDTEHEVVVSSPNYRTPKKHVGGRPNDRG